MNDRDVIKAWQGGVILDPSHPPKFITAHPSWNRWRMFTDEEMAIFGRAPNDPSDVGQALRREYLAEIERRAESTKGAP